MSARQSRCLLHFFFFSGLCWAILMGPSISSNPTMFLGLSEKPHITDHPISLLHAPNSRVFFTLI